MAETVSMPKLGFDMAEGTLVRWVIAEGETVAKGAVLAEIETDKATVEVESAYDGVVRRHLVEQGTVVPVGTPIAIIGDENEKIEETPVPQTAIPAGNQPGPGPIQSPQVTATAPVQAPAEGGEFPLGVRVSPLARRLAEEKRIDLKAVKGSGPQGRIVKRDIEAFLAKPAVAPIPAPVPAPAPAIQKKATLPAPVLFGPPPPDEVIERSRLRVAIGRRMTEAKQQVPHFYVTHEYDVAPLLALRKQVNALLDESEKVSVNDFIVKAAALTLRQFPNLNASLDGDQVLRHGQVNMGVAVAVEGGLLTVVCRDADRKPLRQIANEVRVMVGRAREGKVRPDDIEGSTFSISNMGMFDVEHFIAIINPPEAAILAVGSAREVPIVKDGEIKPGMRMKVTISVDHRVSDGAEAAQFLQALAQYIEEPLRLLV
jgi:pyruvate dehydrogenase E2 component (dihydrolipoyllysine-residue acetyltransferase)